MMKIPMRMGDRLAVLERQLKPQARGRSKAERDARVKDWLAEPANLAPSLAGIGPNDHHGRAAIEAAFRSDG